MIAIDGPAGSGKTSLAGKLVHASEAQLVHMDDVYPGWEGLRAAGTQIEHLLLALASGRRGIYRRYDWEQGAYAEEHVVQPQGTLIVEGVGSVRREYLTSISLIVMVQEPDAVERLRRGLVRDGIDAKPHWERWMREEDDLHREVGLAQLADVVVNGYGELVK